MPYFKNSQTESVQPLAQTCTLRKVKLGEEDKFSCHKNSASKIQQTGFYDDSPRQTTDRPELPLPHQLHMCTHMVCVRQVCPHLSWIEGFTTKFCQFQFSESH